jgi:excisionase family DNA binding protein
MQRVSKPLRGEPITARYHEVMTMPRSIRRPAPFGSATMVDAKEIAAFLACSPKHVRTLAEQGRMPKPVKIGRLSRWHRDAIERWLADRL